MTRRKFVLLVSTIAILPLLPGCTSMPLGDVVEPKDVTVSQALTDIGTGFANMDKELKGKVLGVYPCKVTVNLNLTASATNEGKVVIDLSPDPEKVNFERRGEATAERGNTISVEMYNPACLPNDTLGYEKPEKIDEAMEGMAVTSKQAGAALNIYNELLNFDSTSQ